MWVVYLEGSMFCWNGESCQDRYHTKPYFMSSAIWAPQMAQGGIFDDKLAESGFADSNAIYLKYCALTPCARAAGLLSAR